MSNPRPTITTDCPKCTGKGYLDGLSGIDSGRCWNCNATGKVTILVSSKRATERRRAKAAEAEKVRCEDHVAQRERSLAPVREALAQRRPDLAEILADKNHRHVYIVSEAVECVAFGGIDLDEAISLVDWKTDIAPREYVVNRRRGKCASCSKPVKSGTGIQAETASYLKVWCSECAASGKAVW